MRQFFTQYKSSLAGMLVCYTTLLVLATTGMIAAARLPHEAIEANCQTSIEQLIERGDAPEILNCPLLRIDTFTDMIMLNIAYSMGRSTPVESAMRCSFYTDDEMDVFKTSAQLTASDTNATGSYFLDYGRYWHGYQLILRPLLSITTHDVICRWISFLHCCLLLMVLTLVWRRCTPATAVCLLLSLSAVAFPMSFLCLQFSTCFLLMYAGAIAVTAFRLTTRNALYVFFVLGAATSFFDLLTTPQLTLGIPLALYLLADRTKMTVRHVFLFTICWASGYALMWLGKLPVAWALTGDNIAGEFITSAFVRSSAGVYSLFDLVASKIGTNAVTPLTASIAVGILGLIFVGLWLWRRLMPTSARFGSRYSLLLIAMTTPCWYMLMLQHSIIHYWFTWRAQAVTIFCILIYCLERRHIYVAPKQQAKHT